MSLDFTISSVSAMGNGDGMHKGQGNGASNMENHNPGEMLQGIDKQDLNEIEKDLLLKQYEEEMMANELYASFYEKYGIETFKNIAISESKHMQAVKALLDRYELAVPTNYDHIKDLYEDLKNQGSKSASQALEVGVKIEFVDIDDIITAIKSTDNDDIKIVFTNIGGASYNHLRGFLKAIENNGYETKLDWEKYISKDDLNVRGPIKYKLVEKLESLGVELPSQVSLESMKKNKGHGKMKGQGNGKGNYNKILAKKQRYKGLLKVRYGKVISKIRSNNDLKIKILQKVDNYIEKIQKSDKLEDVKISNIALLNALKDLLQE